MKFSKLLILSLTIVLSSCAKYLEEMPQNKLMPSTTTDYDQLLNKAYISRQIMPFLDIASDDVILKAEDHVMPNADPGDFMVGAYMWDNTHETTMSGGDIAFASFYESIFYTNTVIENIDDAVGVDLNETKVKTTKNNIKGEAMILRAYSYFYLVNLYATPYNPATASSDMGIPVNLSTDAANKAYTRNTVQQVYDQMLKDLTEGITLLEENNIGEKGKFKFNEISAKLLLSRVYLYMQNWTEAAKTAKEVMEFNSQLFNLYEAGERLNKTNNTGTAWNAAAIWGDDYLGKNNSNILFVNGLNEIVPTLSYWPFITTFSINPALGEVYEENDVRRFYFMHTYQRSTYAGLRVKLSYAKNRFVSSVYTFDASPSSGYTRTLRVEEAFLIYAEAKAMLKEKEEAVKYLNTLRAEKFRRGKYTVLNASDFTNESLVNFVLLERRKEFCFEGHRWFDLRRTTREPLTRTGYENKEASLKKDDVRYVFQIPKRELDINPEIKNNPR